MGPKIPSYKGENLLDPPQDDRLLLKWLESQPDENKQLLTEQKLTDFLDQAAQPRHASGNACIKLCYFIEQCRGSNAPLIRDVALSEGICLCLFNFYIEWNEKNQNRSMRQVLELVSSLIAQNPDKKISGAIKDSILQRNLSIIGHKAAQPLVKPAFKSLECLLSKATVSTAELIEVYQSQAAGAKGSPAHFKDTDASWDSLIAESFDWMALPDVSPAAGKFLVTVFRELRSAVNSEISVAGHTTSWQRWIRRGLSKDPKSLENVKNYLFPPLFKLDRPGSLAFLEDLNSQKPFQDFQYQEMDAHALLQLAAMEIGKKSGLVEEPSTIQFQKALKKKSASIVLQDTTIWPLLIHASETVRSLAFSVLVSSSSSIRPFTPMSLDILQASMGILYSDIDAKFRNEVLSNTKHMIERLRGATAFLKREVDALSFSKTSELDKDHDQSDVNALMRRHEEFLEWYLDFLLGELIPTSSYQRHITALRALHLLLRSGIQEQDSTSLRQIIDNNTMWPFSIKFFTSSSLRLLLDLLMDPFEDVRGTATAILKLAPSSSFTTNKSVEYSQRDGVHQSSELPIENSQHLEESILTTDNHSGDEPSPSVESLDILKKFLVRANETSKRTGRADYADGVARCYELLYSLASSTEVKIALVEQLVSDLVSKVALAEEDLGRAVLEAPIHGTFAALNLAWDSVDHSTTRLDSSTKDIRAPGNMWDKLQVRMYHCCLRIWHAVQGVLCNDSPEGHLPQDIDDVETIDTKDVLSYSFRAIHESSNLMRTMASKIKLNWRDGTPVLPNNLFPNIGDLTFAQLSNLRHRGAFSTVSLTFARFCQLTQHQVSEQPSLKRNLLEVYYQGSLKCVFEQASTTRRSAGIPALITGILSSNARQPAFQDVMTELKSLARRPVQLSETDETNLPQVHTMNCLKEIFKSSTLGKRSEEHIAECLQIAADSLNSDIWAIRNCGLLLLRSLIDCLFGTSESKAVTEAGWDGRSIKLSYDKYPALPELLLKLLDTETSISDDLSRPAIGVVESVFPALDIIRRAGPPDVNRDEIYKLVSKHLGNEVWHVREIAARTICTLLLHGEWLSAVGELLESCNESANWAHGVLLAVRFFIERRLSLDSASARDQLQALVALLPTSQEYIILEQGCPQVRAAKLELINTIGLIIISASPQERLGLEDLIDRIFAKDACAELRDTLKMNCTEALLQVATIRRAVLTSATRDDSTGLRNIVRLAAETGIDITLAALECVPQAWKSTKDTLFQLSEAYIVVLESSTSAEVRAVAITNVVNLLDQNFCLAVETHPEVISRLQVIKVLFQNGKGSPNLSNAEIRISGWIQLLGFLPAIDSSSDSLAERITAWGEMLGSGGKADKDSDTRHAAASALHSFFGGSGLRKIPIEEYILPSLFALYDTLNDDDDEIRDIGAATVSSILKKSLVPLAAREEFTSWLTESFGHFPSLAWTAMTRIIGGPEGQIASAESQLLDAMREDDALFVEEEQNLFIDEVRELKLWSEVFGKLPREVLDSGPNRSGTLPLMMAVWATGGLAALNTITNKDGPFGWASKPSVFTACMRVITCANIVLEFINRHFQPLDSPSSPLNDPQSLLKGEIKAMIAQLEIFINQVAENDIHRSLLSKIQSERLQISSILMLAISLKSRASWISTSPPKRPHNLQRPKS